jgi:starch phosphorylase
MATAFAARDQIMERLLRTQEAHKRRGVRRLYYLSMEYFPGKLLQAYLASEGLLEAAAEALETLGQDLEALMEQEHDMGLGNGGLGRLASCLMESLATLGYPAIGYGIHYEFGAFRQRFENGYQVEEPDEWREHGDPWGIFRPSRSQKVPLYGELEGTGGNAGSRWVHAKEIIGIAHDVPIPGHGHPTVNFLRLWSSHSTEELDLEAFNQGGYFEAVREKTFCETISKILYPNDKTESGKELRFIQQYFFVSCSLQDILRRFKLLHEQWDAFPEMTVIQLNDTHPALAVAELVRLLVDREGVPWEKAWRITTQTFAYTNHTLLPEALETWSVPLFEKVLPRHLEIIYRINHDFLETIETRFPGDVEIKRKLSLIEESNPKMVRMAHLAVLGSYSVNGVSKLHSTLLQTRLFPEFSRLFPERFQNKTNGISQRTWLLLANRRLAQLLTEAIGSQWVFDLQELRKLEPWSKDSGFREAFFKVKQENKRDLLKLLQKLCGIRADEHSMLDVQIKRIHEYKRQHLNLLHIVSLYLRLLDDPDVLPHPVLFLFAGKAAPGYEVAKCVIKAIHSVAAQIQREPKVREKMQVVFVPNYGVSLAQKIIPAADLSEQISTAGREASGTGNMKLALNGALTLGTWDGANIEIAEEVGEENLFLFGLRAEELARLAEEGYSPWQVYKSNPILREALDRLTASTLFLPRESPAVLGPLRKSLLEDGDPFFVMADFEGYNQVREQAFRAYLDQGQWIKKAILTVARMGKFSSDRMVQEYAKEIWKIRPVPIRELGS